MPHTGSRNDPIGNFRFRVEIDGIAAGQFREVQFPESRADVIEYREGGDPTLTSRLLPGRVSFGRVVLKRGIQLSNALWEWWEQTLNGSVVRANGSIIALTAGGDDFKRWNFRQAWPAAYEVSDLDALGNEVLIETLEIVHEGIELDD